MNLSAVDIREFREAVYAFYRHNGRHDLPWRNTDNAYRVLLSEIMLQQTQVSRVGQRYGEFLDLFPTLEALARAPLREVLAAWSGLGYNRRARFLHELAQIVVSDYSGQLPESADELRRLPGIGEYTASAVACFAYGKAEVVLETNIRRAIIYSFFAVAPSEPDMRSGDHDLVTGQEQRRLFVAESFASGAAARFPSSSQEFYPRVSRAPVHDRDVKSVASEVLDTGNARHWNYALMDYGEVIGRTVPNPNRHSAHYRKQSPFKGSKREVRGALVRALSSVPHASESVLAEQTGFSAARISSALQDLFQEGFVEQEERSGMWQIR